MSAWTLGMVTAATMVTSLRGLPAMAREEPVMLFSIGIATLLFLIPAGLVAAELGGRFAHRTGGVYTWVGEAFGSRWGFLAIWLQWIQHLVWYPIGLGFAAAAIAFAIDDPGLAGHNVYVGVFCIAAYWLVTLVALTGTRRLAKVTQYGFVLGTALPGLVLLVLFAWWWLAGHPIGWETATDPAASAGHGHPRWTPYLTGLGTLAFLGAMLLNFAGVEAQAVHATELRRPKRQYPTAVFIAVVASVAILTVGSLAVAGIVPYGQINQNSGVFDTLTSAFSTLMGVGWPVPVLSVLICYGALGGALAWLAGPSRGLLATAHDGMLPPVLQRTNKNGMQRNILIVQGVVVTLISSVYLFMADVSAAFFLLSSMTISLYVIMYLLMYAAAIKLRRGGEAGSGFRIPGGAPGLYMVAGIGFLAVAFALVLCFVPPDRLAIGTPAVYIGTVAAGAVVFTLIPMIIYALRRPAWRQGGPHASLHPEPHPDALGAAGAAGRAHGLSGDPEAADATGSEPAEAEDEKQA